MYRDLLVKEACEELSDEEKEALPLVAEAYSKIRQVVESSMVVPPSNFPCIIKPPIHQPPYSPIPSLLRCDLTTSEGTLWCLVRVTRYTFAL